MAGSSSIDAERLPRGGEYSPNGTVVEDITAKEGVGTAATTGDTAGRGDTACGAACDGTAVVTDSSDSELDAAAAASMASLSSWSSRPWSGSWWSLSMDMHADWIADGVTDGAADAVMDGAADAPGDTLADTLALAAVESALKTSAALLISTSTAAYWWDTSPNYTVRTKHELVQQEMTSN
ncbi:MAG: hypothetical protein JSS07_12795 [Proteobacteria bacterium]|nr:hypothetical protein [Pseudomonadota bacterium]